MLASRLTKQEECSIARTHSASVPAYIMRDDGSVTRFWPGGRIERIVTGRSQCVRRCIESKETR